MAGFLGRKNMEEKIWKKKHRGLDKK